MDKKLLLSKIDASKRELLEAEEHLTLVLRDSRGARRADKVTMTETIREALAKLAIARTDLEDAGKLIAGEVD